jgi:hypothetical protein
MLGLLVGLTKRYMHHVFFTSLNNVGWQVVGVDMVGVICHITMFHLSGLSSSLGNSTSHIDSSLTVHFVLLSDIWVLLVKVRVGSPHVHRETGTAFHFFAAAWAWAQICRYLSFHGWLWRIAAELL